MTKTPEMAVDWLIDVMKQALEEGRATPADLEDWLLTALALEDLALEDLAYEEDLSSWISPSNMIH